MVVSAKPSLITLSSNLLHCICLQHIYHACIFPDLTPKINRCHSMINLFLHCPNSQEPKEIVSFNKYISINVLCLEIKKKKKQELAIVADLFTSYLLSESLFAECSDISTCQTVVSLSCRAFSSLQGLMFFSMQETVNCNKSWRGRPVETNGSAFDK